MAEYEVIVGDRKKRVIMFPFMAHGHLNPFMALAEKLVRRGSCTITIVNTPWNIQTLKSSFPPDSKTNISFAEIPFNSARYGLPVNAENMGELSPELSTRFLEASENLEPHFRNLLISITEKEGKAPACIISDMFLGWTIKVANELGIFHSVFIAGAGYGMGIYFSLSLNISQRENGEEFSLLDFPEASRIHQTQLGGEFKYSDETVSWFCFRERQFLFCLSSDAILLNSIPELDGMGAKYFHRKTRGKPIYMVGPICSSPKRASQFPDDFSAWLDLHPPGSVLYVCFGSQFTILPSQMRELAKGLEESGVGFIWVIRPPVGFSVTEEINPEWLPDGFQDRIRSRNQGILIYKWAPQVEILRHKSTGGFLSHCGWNSVLESLCNGVPIIGWPLEGEQRFNSNFLEKEVGVCLEMARGTESATIKCDDVARTIKMAMGQTEKGEEMRRKALEIKKKMEDAIQERDGFKGSSVQAMDEFLSIATSTR
ncbi:hypothetical protein SLE2022_199320 [Rubroshorea leprosula]